MSSAETVWEFVADSDRANAYRVRRAEPTEWLEGQPEAAPPLPFELARGPRKTGTRGGPERLQKGEAADLAQRLWASLPPALRQDHGWIQVVTAVERLIDVPWECLRGPGGPLASTATLTRAVPVQYPIPATAVKLPLRVVLVLTNPKDERLLDAQREMRAVRPDGVADIQVFENPEPTLESLKRSLEAWQPHVVHYIGHAAASSGQGHLILHDFNANTRWLTAEELASALPPSVRLLCLSTCFTAENYDLRGFSRLAHAPATVALPTVLLNQLPLAHDSEPVVRQFWRTFYQGLLELNGSVLGAYEKAWRSAVGSPHDDWASWSLVVRDGNGAPFVFDGAPDSEDPSRKAAEYHALIATRLANSMVQQSGSLSPSVRQQFQVAAKRELQNAEAGMEPYGGVRWGKR